ncbi:MFS domain-containing protein [Mycena sanguinolenta]|uniref:MFS domain-containing protein n=1 Tax=Mycena sanguinolenta TaxID=230812 RepID=A0A8H6Y0B6_9AGAR|nr:MFS domain-containing protein [Mycena sanguinolenta]
MSNTPSTVIPENIDEAKPPRDARFWLIFLSLCVSNFITALELGSITAALPTIVNALHGEQFIWAGSAYALGTTALIPLAGGLAEIFGRRSVLLGSLVLFAAGSTVCGAAQNMNMLIAGRGVQGLGAGGIISLTHIIVADLVSLCERGVFNGLIAMAYTVGTGSGPVVGGTLAASGNWRWLFYLNIPICALAALLVFSFLRLRAPAGTMKERFAKVDYFGNGLVVAATTSIVVALAVVAPLISGLIGLAAFFVYEAHYAKHATIPFDVMNTITGLSGYIQTFLNFVVMIIIVYYNEVYFQARFDVSPTGAGIDGMPLAFLSPTAGLIAGVIIQKTTSYRVPIMMGWSLLVLGLGLLSTLDENTSRAKTLAFSVISGLGTGSLILATYFPVLAPIPVSKNANALALFVFIQNFGLVWGIPVGGTILQNELRNQLPADFVAQLPGGVEIAYSIIPVIRTLPEPLRSDVQKAFAQALKIVWSVTTGIACLGFVVGLFMKPYPLHTSVDRNWGMEDEWKDLDILVCKNMPDSISVRFFKYSSLCVGQCARWHAGRQYAVYLHAAHAFGFDSYAQNCASTFASLTPPHTLFPQRLQRAPLRARLTRTTSIKLEAVPAARDREVGPAVVLRGTVRHGDVVREEALTVGARGH